MEMMIGMKPELIFKGKYFKGTENAIHVEDVEVQNMVDKVLKELIDGDCENNISYSTGDTLVFGARYDDEIEIRVSQDYFEACLLMNDDGVWEPVDWNDDDLYEKTKDELIEEIYRLRRIEYNPNKEV